MKTSINRNIYSNEENLSFPEVSTKKAREQA